MKVAIRSLAVTILAASVFACAPATPSVTRPTPSPTVRLSYAPADSGCPLAALPRAFTFRIDPNALDPVVAIGSNGFVYHVFWSQEFRGGTVDESVVLGPDGQVVARNGQRVEDPEEYLPGYILCSGSESLYVLPENPAQARRAEG